MNCKHKFLDNLKLNYVTWEVKTLFIGTFNPGCCSKDDNVANWFYGRTQNNMFWDTLGYIYDDNPYLGRDGNTEVWMSFCEKFNIGISDLIAEITNIDLTKGSDYRDLCDGFSDKKLENYLCDNSFISSAIEEEIRTSQKLKNLKCVCLTRRSTAKPWNNNWKPIEKICQKNKIHTATLTTPGGFNYFQFNKDFPRTPQNLSEIWKKNGLKIIK